MTATDDPLIVTLEMDAPAFARFDALRRRHFPERLNRIPAHVTLFHALPGLDEEAVRGALADAASALPRPEVSVTGLRFLGRGVAYTLGCKPVSSLRDDLARTFGAVLTAQDRQGWTPHVTVQNKVAPAAARALQAELMRDFAPFSFVATGLLLWRYLGGPWERRASFAFQQGG